MTSASAAEQLLQTTLTIKVQDDSFEFEIPTIHREIALGVRVRNLHKQIDPDWDEFSQGLDNTTLYYLRACAAFELLLKKSSAKWPWTQSATTGEVVCDSSKFPAQHADDVALAYRGLLDALATFRTARPADKAPVGTEAVASVAGAA